ncbi:MAG: hypothetical protein IIC02_11955 [Planctomycetes bacterium]|nr:hypothetical protein [Planctomycetota bacterium]
MHIGPTRRTSLLFNTTQVSKATSEDANADYSPYWYDNSAYNRQGAIDRLTDFLPYFDELAALLKHRADSTSRSPAQERKILQKLLNNMEDP